MAELNTTRFLERLAQAGGQGNLRELGAELGLSRDQAETLSLDLMSQDLLEMVNLNGGVRLTEAGRARVGGGAGARSGGPSLAELLEKLEQGGDWGLNGEEALDLSLDLAVLKAQEVRSRPLAPVMSAVCQALAGALKRGNRPGAAGLAASLETLAGK